MRHREFGVLVHDRARTTPGYTLLSPLNGKATYIIGLHGDVVHAVADLGVGIRNVLRAQAAVDRLP